MEQKNLPNATAALVLGILSIVFSCGFIGLILSIIGLNMAKKGKAMYEGAPGEYSESSFKQLNAGRICSIIGLILSILSVLYIIAMFAIYGAAFFTLAGAQY
ncbi:MAG: DUF4190 domain-containing protein [Flavobacteriales bacterium]|nr:DUF4190 domain-containing protein [Flavobacteriales bacterium]